MLLFDKLRMRFPHFFASDEGVAALALARVATSDYLQQESKRMGSFLVQVKTIRNNIMKRVGIDRYKASAMADVVIGELLDSEVLQPFDERVYAYKGDK